ncbi:hypothetical protein F511_39388 [Dorcoceras hygrometricum]|uniref:Uncharacterized protein n=1 Tax=Dorcoceras hygrometricum TaxID=472368 RepID=A0A2Z7BNE7_9LAMI|nr:hypothetical protein F511_39388 [Dorcoceras hygrometricum]
MTCAMIKTSRWLQVSRISYCKSPAGTLLKGSVVEFEKKSAVTNKEFSSWTFSKANPTADDLAKQFQQQRFSSNDQAVTTQQRCKISNNANSADATSSSPRSRFLYAKQDSLYRKLHHGNSKRFLTRTSDEPEGARLRKNSCNRVTAGLRSNSRIRATRFQASFSSRKIKL